MPSEIRPLDSSGNQFPVVRSGLISLALGNGTAFQVFTARTHQGLLVAILSWGSHGGAYTFASPPDAGYVASKLRILPGDAERVARFIDCQLSAL